MTDFGKVLAALTARTTLVVALVCFVLGILVCRWANRPDADLKASVDSLTAAGVVQDQRTLNAIAASITLRDSLQWEREQHAKEDSLARVDLARRRIPTRQLQEESAAAPDNGRGPHQEDGARPVTQARRDDTGTHRGGGMTTTKKPTITGARGAAGACLWPERRSHSGGAMGDHSAIEWTDTTWNPIAGCTRVSAGCDNCYAAALAAGRLKSTKQYKDLAVVTPSGRAAFNGTIRLLEDRLDQPLRWRRPRRIFVNLRQLFAQHDWDDYDTLDALTGDRCALVTGPDDINDPAHWPGLDWVVAGGESGPHHRPVYTQWVRLIQEQCASTKTAFLFKQWGGRTPKAGGRELDGRTWDEYPR